MANDLKPLYLILSNQPFLRNQAVDRLKARFAEMDETELNISEFDGENVDIADVVNACNTLPFLGPMRLVILTRIEALNASDSAALVEYATNPSDTTVLALVGESLAKSTKLYKAVQAHGDVLDRKAPAKKELPSVIIGLGEQQGLKISMQAALALLNTAGEGLDVIVLSIEKIKAYVAPRTTVTVEDVAAVVARTQAVRLWDFINALFERRTSQAMSLLNALLLEKDSNIEMVMVTTTRQLRDLITVRALLDRGESSNSAFAQALKKQDWQVKTLSKQARLFDASTLRQALIDMASVQQQARSGYDKRIAFEKWMLEHFA